MWAEQQIAGKQKGAWLWLRFNNEPWEADDSAYLGATLAAVAVGIAPGNYRATPEVQTSLKLLREYLNREFAVQTTINRALLLWAAAKLPGLLEPDRQKAIIAELLEKQRADGGWSLSSLSGDWKRADGTPQDTTSDGYATGLAVLALRGAGLAADHPKLQRGIYWLAGHQKDGSWPAAYLNQQRNPQDDIGKFMRDAATAFAVLALVEPPAGETASRAP